MAIEPSMESSAWTIDGFSPLQYYLLQSPLRSAFPTIIAASTEGQAGHTGACACWETGLHRRYMNRVVWAVQDHVAFKVLPQDVDMGASMSLDG